MINLPKKMLLIAGALIGMSIGAAWAESSTSFARVVENDRDEPKALQVAIASYGSSKQRGDVTVDLISAIHIGDKSYYSELNQRFEDYDALLYELIAPRNKPIPRDSTEQKSMLSNAQRGMRAALDLSYQLDEIDYNRPNFVHADLTPCELKQSMEEREESLYVYFWRLFYASMDQVAQDMTTDPLGIKNWQRVTDMMSADQDNALKIAFAYQLTDVNRAGNALDGGSGSAIIDARNQRAIEVLKKEIDAGATNIGIFYGVAHMPDLEDRLIKDLDLSYEKTTWIDAWQLTKSYSE